jgi:hypothetical protein
MPYHSVADMKKIAAISNSDAITTMIRFTILLGLQVSALYGTKQGDSSGMLDAAASEKKEYYHEDLVSISSMGLGDEAVWLGEEKDWTDSTPKTWNQWLKDANAREAGENRLHFMTQLMIRNDDQDLPNVHVACCALAKLIGPAGRLYVPGLGKSPFFHDGTKCDDCTWIPNLHAIEEGVVSPPRIPSDATAWPKIRYWQHTLNHMSRLGIAPDDLCVMMDGSDVFPVADTNELHRAFTTFFDGGPEGIMFAADTVCHPFCQDKGCWKWGAGHTFTMASGRQVKSEDMCTRMAELAPGPAKYVCGGLFMGRCKLVRDMLNHVDDVIKEDGSSAGLFDQALYQIMQLRYPELNIRVDSHMQYFQNWNGLGEENRKRRNATTQRFEDLFGVKEEDICNTKKKWSMADFRGKMSKDLIMVHFNGDAKIPLLTRCTHDSPYRPGILHKAALGVHAAVFIAPDLDIVVNCLDGDRVQMVNHKKNTDEMPDNPLTANYRRKVGSRLERSQKVMNAAWYKKYPFAFHREHCVCRGRFFPQSL